MGGGFVINFHLKIEDTAEKFHDPSEVPFLALLHPYTFTPNSNLANRSLGKESDVSSSEKGSKIPG
jgi:hypothetical protein